ncbi:MAG: PHP domain-containing protein [Candidatus Bathyarchaeia archaeon]
MGVLTELHCHTIYSNGFNKSKRIPFESTTTPEDLLIAAERNGVNCLFVTDHNNQRGFPKIREYWQNHARFHKIGLMPGVEISTKEGHVIGLGVSEEIKTGMSVEDTIEEIHRQNGLCVSVHPFALGSGIREKSNLCDLIEIHNSVSVDVYSNKAAENYARKHHMTQVVGSDAHIPDIVGRNLNDVEAESSLDDVLSSLGKGKTLPAKIGYITAEEYTHWIHPKLLYSRDKIKNYLRVSRPKLKFIAEMALNFYLKYPELFLWRRLTTFAMRSVRNKSKKLNWSWLEPSDFEQKDLYKTLNFT